LVATPSPVSASNASPVGFLRVAAFVFFGIFVCSIFLRSLPVRLLDPVWQIAWITALVDMAGYALVGVVVLTLAHMLVPSHRALLHQLLWVSRLSRFAALGFLLLVPLLLSALYRDHARVELFAERQRQSLGQQEQVLRQAIGAARSRSELLQVVGRFNAPALAGFALSEAPLEAQRSEALSLLRAGIEAARRQLETLPQGSLLAILINNLRLIALCLLLALGFSSAHTGRLSFPLLSLLPPLPRRTRDGAVSSAATDAEEEGYFPPVDR
jgi:hypothetical protein